MFYKKNILFLIFIVPALASPLGSYSQEGKEDNNLYGQELENKINKYEDRIDKEFKDEYYNNLILLYTQTNQDPKARKLIRKTIKQFPNNSNYIADLGLCYLREGDKKRAEKEFDKSIENLSADHNSIVKLANYYNVNNNIDYSIKAFKKGRQLLNNPYRFIYEISYLYQMQGRYEAMAEEYISLLDQNPNMLNQIKIYLGNIIQQDTDKKFLNHFRQAILKKAQKEEDNPYIAQLYVWILLQEKDYEMAFLQAKSIDRRFEENTGKSVYEIANIALNNKDHKTSKQAFTYLVSKGSESVYYMISRVGLLNSLYQPFIGRINHTKKEIAALKEEYISTLNELGKSRPTVPIMQQYAYLLAYYLKSPQEAVDILDEILAIAHINHNEKAEIKLMRADIYLMENDIWEASLTYSQVEKEFKNDVIGSEAKFKNAMLSYYNGDFDWAMSQFDVLRSSTTKLIANDAMEYSLLIYDNIDEDSTYNALSLYSKAEFALYQNKYETALSYLDTIDQNYLSHPIFDKVLYKRAEISIKKEEYTKADSLLNIILLKYPYDLMADDALYLLAELNQTHLNSPEKAKEYYERIILDYPNSLYVVEARKRYNEL